ncbi:MAG: hypothetical protein RL154_1075 [Pseudomonadota bacterium]|jgi:type II secretion system protein C
MHIKKSLIFLIYAFALAEVFATATLLMLPEVKQAAPYASTQKQNYFYAFSTLFNRSQVKSLSNYSLKAIFADDGGGFVLFYDGSKQVVLDIGANYSGYTLTRLDGDKAIFSFDGRQYELVLQKNENSVQTFSKQQIDKLFKNPAELIGEIDVTQADGGLTVLKVKNGGTFDKMGLGVGDVIQELNGEKTTSMSSLATILPNLQNATSIKLKILRNNQEKELNYDIK